MPIEIRELVIKMTIEDKPAAMSQAAGDVKELRAELVKECMEKIMSKLENLQER